MPEIVFKGKEYVYNHHLGVPYRPLIPHAGKGVGPADLANGGLDLLTVAQISGTSVRMVEQHYGHLRSDVAATALERLAL